MCLRTFTHIYTNVGRCNNEYFFFTIYYRNNTDNIHIVMYVIVFHVVIIIFGRSKRRSTRLKHAIVNTPSQRFSYPYSELSFPQNVCHRSGEYIQNIYVCAQTTNLYLLGRSVIISFPIMHRRCVQ